MVDRCAGRSRHNGPLCRPDLRTVAPGCALFVNVRDTLTVSRLGAWGRRPRNTAGKVLPGAASPDQRGPAGRAGASAGHGQPQRYQPHAPDCLQSDVPSVRGAAARGWPLAFYVRDFLGHLAVSDGEDVDASHVAVAPVVPPALHDVVARGERILDREPACHIIEDRLPGRADGRTADVAPAT